MKIVIKKIRNFLDYLSRPRFVKVGVGCFIDRTVKFIGPEHGGVVIKDQVIILRNSEICGNVFIDTNVFVNRDVYIRPNVKIGRNVRVGPFVKLISDTHEVGSSSMRAAESRVLPIDIQEGVWIGAGAIILGNVTIKKGAIIGAGSVVITDVEADSLFAGNPAKFIKKLSI